MLDKSKAHADANFVRDVLRNANKFSGETFVFACSRHIMDDDDLIGNFTKDIVILKQSGINPIIIHEGSDKVNSVLKSMDISLNFFSDSNTIKDSNVMEVIEMSLSGLVNKKIVQKINEAGGSAIGLSGRDSNLIEASGLKKTYKDKDLNINRIMSFGFSGEVKGIDPTLLTVIEESDYIPIIAPIGVDRQGQSYSIKADEVASAIAISLAATKLIIFSNLSNITDRENNLMREIKVSEAREYIKKGFLSKDIVNKIQSCIKTVESGTGIAHIINDTVAGSVLLSILANYSSIGIVITSN